MATHDYSIANQSFPATRSDINNALAAIQSSNSAATAPSGTGSTVAGELFYNTTANKLQIATDANGTFVDVALDSSGNQTVTGTLGVTGVATFTAEAVFNGGLALGDSDKATFGAGDDLEIYHDGSDSYISDTGTGSLIMLSTGTTDNFVLQTNDAGSASAPDLVFYRNSSSPADSDAAGRIMFRGKNSAGEDINYSVIQSTLDDVTDGTEDGYLRFYTMRAGSDTESFRMEADGDFHADGDLIAYSTTVSDERLKTGIHTIQDALDKVYCLKGVEFTYKADGKRSAGLIAQDVEKVLPSAVSEKELPLKVNDGNLYKTLQYDQTIGLLVEAVKELKDLVDEQAQEIELLKKG